MGPPPQELNRLTDWQTNTTENITFPHTTYVGGNNSTNCCFFFMLQYDNFIHCVKDIHANRLIDTWFMICQWRIQGVPPGHAPPWVQILSF